MTVEYTTAQNRLHEAVTESGRADFSEPDDPADLTEVNAASWGDRALSAEALRRMILEVAGQDGKPFELVGARVIGPLDLAGLTLPRIFSLRRCILDAVELGHSLAGRLDLSGSHVRGSMKVRDLKVGGEVLLQNISVDDGIDLESARVDGTVDLRGASLRSHQTNALVIAGARVGGSVRLDDADVDGVINARGVRIDGRLMLQGVKVRGRREEPGPQASTEPPIGTPQPTAWALLADHAVVEGAVQLSTVLRALTERATVKRNAASLTGQVSFFAADIGGNFEGDYCYLRTEAGYALTLETARVGGAVLLRGAHLHGGARLFSAQITSGVECDGGLFIGHPRIAAVDAGLCKVDGPINLRNGFEAEGGVLAPRATIGAHLDCTGGHFYGRPPGGLSADDAGVAALSLRDTAIEGNVYLSAPFTAEGEVMLRGATVAASCNAGFGLFKNPRPDRAGRRGTPRGERTRPHRGHHRGRPEPLTRRGHQLLRRPAELAPQPRER